MPKNLSDDPDDFTSPVVVPVGTDPRTAASVEEPFQALANRTATLEADLAERSLQGAYAQSVANAETAPHIDIAGATLAIGGTASAALLTVNGTTGEVGALSGLTVEGGIDVDDGTIDVGAGAAVIDQDGLGTFTDLQVNNDATVDGILDAATMRIAGNDIPSLISAGSITVTMTARAGTGSATNDVTDGKGSYLRIGSRVAFGMYFSLDCTGYATTGYTMNFAIPIASNFVDLYDVQATARGITASGAVEVEAYADASANNLKIAFTLASVPATLDVHISGTYEVI